MADKKFDALKAALSARKEEVYAYLRQPEYASRFHPAHIESGVYSYIDRGGKWLRPAVVMWSCGAVGGDPRLALPAAGAAEVYHTMTLVHDDIIDRDDMRRGGPTVHHQFASQGVEELGYEAQEGLHYGLTIAILSGDLQHAWAMLLLTDLADKFGVDARLVLACLADLSGRVSPNLVGGEALDYQISRRPLESLAEADIIDMITKKTAILLDFAGRAGAAIGLGDPTLKAPAVEAIATFCRLCGIAFQLQDDVLGIVGDETRLGKPVGSDIREGKRTTVVLKAYREANAAQRDLLDNTLGNPQATHADIEAVITLLQDLGGIAHTTALARQYSAQAVPYLDDLAPSEYKDLLLELARYVVEREL